MTQTQQEMQERIQSLEAALEDERKSREVLWGIRLQDDEGNFGWLAPEEKVNAVVIFPDRDDAEKYRQDYIDPDEYPSYVCVYDTKWRIRGYSKEPDGPHPVLSINDIMSDGFQTIKDKGFYVEEQDFLSSLMMVCEELGEACSAYRNGKSFLSIETSEGGKPEGIAVELGDAITRICVIAEKYGMPLPRAIRDKMAYNKKRAFKFGGKRC